MQMGSASYISTDPHYVRIDNCTFGDVNMVSVGREDTSGLIQALINYTSAACYLVVGRGGAPHINQTDIISSRFV